MSNRLGHWFLVSRVAEKNTHRDAGFVKKFTQITHTHALCTFFVCMFVCMYVCMFFFNFLFGYDR